jgi:ATP-dependent exoDNAse (exonuclease V) alpha subunit
MEKVEMADGKPAYQLKEVSEIGAFIKNKVLARKKGKRNISDINWEELLNSTLDEEHGPPDNDDEEILARKEKAAALREIAEARISLLIGSAGTGKTTLLSILANHEEVKNKGILLLAPTGKARVKMEQAIGLSSRKDPKVKAYNLAQFLIKSKRFDPNTGRFLLNDERPQRVGETVIIDEASMLTEEMLGSLLQSIKGYKRLILVGDRYQLPPIGTGRPFVDIIKEFEPENIGDEAIFPKFGPSYAELIINRRQSLPQFKKCGRRVDVQLANWFRGGSVKATDDEIFDILNGSVKSNCLKIYRWEEEEEFRKLLFEILKKELDLKNDGDFRGFNNSLGAIKGSFKVGSAERTEDWQILSPVRNRAHGVSEINREIHQKFKGDYIRSSKSRENKKKKMTDFTKKAQPAGLEEIVWGDKVINIRNQSLGAWNTIEKGKEDGYLANGEIGLLVETPKINNKFFVLKFEFSSQPDLTYSFFDSLTPMDRKYKFLKLDEDQPSIELAYALTVHKAQGSEFGKVILVIPKYSFNLSRELIYTALTRQKEGIIILYEGDPIDLMSYSEEKWSETNQRFTNLFQSPHPRPVKDKNDLFLEDRLINRTLRGEDVRSKSELIIANILYHHDIDYEYEGVLTFGDETRRPDFVIEDEDSGETYYWEHLGMLNQRSYRNNWKKKKQWYKMNGITENGGPNGTLITSVDNPKGGISSQEIEETLREYSLID